MSTKKYKLSRYAVPVEDGETLFLFNTLNGALLSFDDPSRIERIKNIAETKLAEKDGDPELFEALKSADFIFSGDIDEFEIAKQIFIDTRGFVQSRLRIMIYTTNECNFRCNYCPQPHINKNMTPEILDNICSAIEKLLNSGRYKKLSISWFGGEPLLNLGIIERGMLRFGEICKEKGIELSSSITTNGYNLTQNTLRRLFDLGVLEYQITVDGTEKTHDRTRVLKNGAGTWRRIWNNLISMCTFEDKFIVHLRINVNSDNMSEAKELINMLNDNFDDRFQTQIQAVMNMGGVTHPDANFCTPDTARELLLDIYSYLGRVRPNEVGQLVRLLRPFGFVCNCADPHYFVVRTDGMICKCELEVDDEFNILGSGDSGALVLDYAKLSQYIAPVFAGECETCRMFPLCYGLSCPQKKAKKNACAIVGNFRLDEYTRTLGQIIRSLNLA